MPDDTETTHREWDWSPQEGEPGKCYNAQVWGPDGDAIATVESYPDPHTANDRARLMAAAPELLEVARMAKAFIEKYTEKYDRIPKGRGREAMVHLDNVIEKATE